MKQDREAKRLQKEAELDEAAYSESSDEHSEERP